MPCSVLIGSYLVFLTGGRSYPLELCNELKSTDVDIIFLCEIVRSFDSFFGLDSIFFRFFGEIDIVLFDR